MSERASPFQDLGDFAPKAEQKKPDAGIINQIASENGYHSRTVSSPDPAKRNGRRRAVKRGRQLNIKVTDDAAEQFYDIVDRLDVPLGRVFELAIAAYARQLDDKASD